MRSEEFPDRRSGKVLADRMPGWAGLKALGDWGYGIEADGVFYSEKDVQAEPSRDDSLVLKFGAASLTWRWKVTVRDEDVLIAGELSNDGTSPVRLSRVFHLRLAGKLPFAPAGQRTLVLPQPPGQAPRFVAEIGHEAAQRNSLVKAQFFNADSGAAVQVGYTSFHKADTRVEYETDEAGGMTRLQAWCDFANWELPAGQSVRTEDFRLAVGDNPFRQLETWAELAAEHCRPRQWPESPLGYLGWSWVDTVNGPETSEENVIGNVDAIRRRLKGLGFSYVWVSMGNLAGSMPGNWLEWNTRHFPGGHEKLVAALRERGFKLGLWIGPFYVSSALTERVEEYREALLKDAHGDPLVVCREWRHGDAGRLPREERPRLYALDPSHPRAREFIRKVFAAYRDWGVRYYMIDFLDAGAGSLGPFRYEQCWDRRKTPGVEPWYEFLGEIRDAAGDDTYLLGSSGPTIHCAGVCDGIRTGCDFGEGRPISPDSFFYPASFVINKLEFWTGAKMALVNQAACWYMHRKLFINDSGNVLTVDKPIPLETARIHAAIHAFSGGPSMLGDDIRRIDEERIRLIRVTLPRPRDVAFPLDLFEHPLPDYPHVYWRRVEKAWGDYAVVAIYNFDPQPFEADVDLARLGMSAEAEHLVWEFWNCEFVGRLRERLTVSVPPVSVRVFRLVRDAGRPVLLGTDMHLLMGETDVTVAAWDEESATFTLEAERPEGEQGSAYVYAPKTVCVKNPEGLYVAKDGRDDSLVIRVPFVFEGGPLRRTIRFGRLPTKEET